MVNKSIKKTEISLAGKTSKNKKFFKERVYKSKRDDRRVVTSVTPKNKLKSKKVNKRAFSKKIRFFNFKSFYKKQLKLGLIRNRESALCQKVFTKKINLNKIQGSRTFNSNTEARDLKALYKPNTLRLKASIYILLKALKNLKKMTLGLSTEDSSLDKLDQLCLGLERSGFYFSVAERKKKDNFDLLKIKIKKRLCKGFLGSVVRRKNVGRKPQIDSPLIPIKYCYQTFQKKSIKVKNRLNTLVKRRDKQALTIKKGFVHLKKNYSYITESRLSLYMASHRKKYTKLFRIMKSNKLMFRRLFFNFQIKQLRHTFRMKKRYKLYRSLAWKRKKKKNRKKVGLFYFLRRRPRMLFRFYVPRHLEINYKTFSLAHLGALDLPSVNSRISFWLNLRRLLTSLAI